MATKDDLILQMIDNIEKHNREDHQKLFDKIDKINCERNQEPLRSSMSAKELTIFGGIITTVCTCIVTVIQIIVK